MILQLKNLKLKTILGVHDWERTEEREVLVNAEIEYDAQSATETDQIDHALDYYELSQKIIALAKNSEFFLLETLTQKIGELISQDSRIQSVRLSVEKPHPFPEIESVVAQWEKK